MMASVSVPGLVHRVMRGRGAGDRKGDGGVWLVIDLELFLVDLDRRGKSCPALSDLRLRILGEADVKAC